MTVALTATMFSGVSVYAESSDPEPFKIGFPWDTANTDPTWISIYNNVKDSCRGLREANWVNVGN